MHGRTQQCDSSENHDNMATHRAVSVAQSGYSSVHKVAYNVEIYSLHEYILFPDNRKFRVRCQTCVKTSCERIQNFAVFVVSEDGLGSSIA